MNKRSDTEKLVTNGRESRSSSGVVSHREASRWCGANKAGKREEMRKQIRSKFHLGPEVAEIPVLCLSGVETGDATSPDFDVFWDFLETAPPLDTTNLRPFENVADKIKHLVDERNRAVLEIEAHRAKFTVLLAFAALAIATTWRALLPSVLSRLLLNYPGPEDEIILFTCLFQFLGPQRVNTAAKILWRDHGRGKVAKLKDLAARLLKGHTPTHTDIPGASDFAPVHKKRD